MDKETACDTSVLAPAKVTHASEYFPSSRPGRGFRSIQECRAATSGSVTFHNMSYTPFGVDPKEVYGEDSSARPARRIPWQRAAYPGTVRLKPYQGRCGNPAEQNEMFHVLKEKEIKQFGEYRHRHFHCIIRQACDPSPLKRA
jgi:hypothetical protein